MRKIIASLDIGSSFIKLVVGEIIKNKINILACVETPSQGIKKGYVINAESATEAFAEVFKKVEGILGMPVKKVIATVPSLYTECFLSGGTIPVSSPDKVITSKDIIKGMQMIKDISDTYKNKIIMNLQNRLTGSNTDKSRILKLPSVINK